MVKINEISLYDVIGEKKDKFEFSFLTTFNAYLPFYEQIVLRRLVKAGCRVNTLLMDAGQFTGSFNEVGGIPQSAGRDYTLIPVSVANGVFHPKILLLLGKENASLCVGSHNLTLSGFGKNRELTSLFEFGLNSNLQDRGIFQDVWRTLRQWTAIQPEELIDSFRFVENEMKWLTETEKSPNQESTLLYAAGENTQSLWEQIKPQISGKVQKIIMISPFFDEDLRFVNEIAESLSPKEFVIAIEPSSVFLPLNSPNKFTHIKFVNAGKLRNNRGYLHAKLIYLETDSKRNLLITGSANMSGPAWLNGFRRNCEAVVFLNSKEAISVVKDLGLDELSKNPAITESEWQLIERNKLNRAELFSENEPKPVLIAFETDSGFKIVFKSTHRNRLREEVEFFDSSGEKIHQGQITANINEEIFLEVQDSQIRLTTHSIKLSTESGEIFNCFVHHTPAILAKFHKVSHRDFFTALESFDIPVDNKFWRLFEQIVFEEGNDLPDYMEAGISYRPADDYLKTKVETTETLQDTFSIQTAEIEYKNRLNQNLTDSLSELISFLNRRLYSPAEHSQNFALPSLPNEEELDNEEFETEDIVDPKFEIEQIATHYYQRTRTMMRRMTKKLDLLQTDEFRMLLASLRQITVVLGLLHWVRQLEKHEKFAACEKELVSIDDEWKLFISSVTFLIRLENIPSEIKNNSHRFSELHSMVVGYLVWLGYDSGFDIIKLSELRQQKYGEERTDGWTKDEILEGTAAFLKLAVQFCDNKQAETTFWKAVENDGDEDWIYRNLEWLQKISQASKTLSQLPFSTKRPGIGDLSIQTKMQKPEILVVSNDPSHIELVILNAESRRKKYGDKTVSFLDI